MTSTIKEHLIAAPDAGELAGLLDRVDAATETDNSLDVEIEIAVFQPDRHYASVRANSAGTKVIYTSLEGKDYTCWSWDWTLNAASRKLAKDAIRSLIAKAEGRQP